MSDEFEKYPVYRRIPMRDDTWYVIIMIVIIVIVLVVGFVVYIVLRGNTSETRGLCLPGVCVFSKIDGTKRCPTLPTERLDYNIGLEGCTSASYCQEDPYTCAVIVSQGTLNADGVCGQGNNNCPCIRCPTSI